MTPDQPTPLSKAPLFTAREVWWTMFAALSVCYLAVHTFVPEWLDDLTAGNRLAANQQDDGGQQLTSRQTGDIRSLQASVAQLQLDLAKVKTELDRRAEFNQVLASKVSALEQRAAAVAQVQAPVAAPAPVAAADQAPLPPAATAPSAASAIAAAGPATDLQAATSQAAPAPVASPAPRIINAAPIPAPAALAAAPLETGSLADAAPIDFGPAVVKKTAKPVGLQISSAASVDGLRESWANLSANNPDALLNMQPLYVAKGPANNPAFDLVAGPVKSRAEAQKLCKALTERGVACKVGAFEGSAL